MKIIDSSTQTKDTYNAIAKKYSNVYSNIPDVIKYCKILIGSLDKHQNNILDLGCGDGYLEKFIEGNYPDKKIIGIDYSEKLIKIAKSKGVKSKLIIADIRDIDFKEKFDGIISSFTLIHLNDKDTQKVLKNIYRLLKRMELFFIFYFR